MTLSCFSFTWRCMYLCINFLGLEFTGHICREESNQRSSYLKIVLKLYCSIYPIIDLIMHKFFDCPKIDGSFQKWKFHPFYYRYHRQIWNYLFQNWTHPCFKPTSNFSWPIQGSLLLYKRGLFWGLVTIF